MAVKSFPKYDGYQGIWFTLGQFSEYGDKYSGGLGTYTAKHVPLAVYSEEAKKLDAKGIPGTAIFKDVRQAIEKTF